MPGRGEVLIRILGDSSSLDTALAGSTSKLSAFGSALTSPAGLAVAAGVVVAGALFKIGEDFNNAFIIIRRETGATGDELGKLEGDFKTVVSTVPASFGDAALAVSRLHMELGLNGGQLDRESEQVLELNRVTGGVLSETVAGATDLFNNWQISTKNQAGTLDELFRASQLSGASIQTLFDDMKSSGGVMREMGFSFNDTITIMSGFEKAGLNTQQIVAGMRIGLGNFAKAGEEPRAAFERLVTEIQSAPTRIQGTADAIAVFGKRSGVGLADAIQTGRISFDDLMKGIVNGSDTIRKAGEDTMTLGDKWKLLKNEVFVAVQPIASAFFTGILDGVDFVVGGFKDISKFVGEFVDDWENGTDKAGVGAGHLKDIVHTIWRTITDDVAALKGIWQPVADAVEGAWGHIWDTFKNGSPALSGATSQLGDLKSAIWDAFKDSPTFIREFETDWDTGSNKAGVSASKIKDVLHTVWSTIKSIFNDISHFISQFSDDWANGTNKAGIAAGKLAQVFHSLWDTAKSAFDAISAIVKVNLEVIAGLVIVAVKIIEDLWTRFGSHLVQAIKDAWGEMLDVIRGTLEVIKGVFDVLSGIFTLDFSKVWKGITEIFGGAWTTMVGMVHEFLTIISTAIGLGMAVISLVWGYAWGAIKSVASEVWGAIQGAVGFGMALVHNAIMGPLNALSAAWGATWGAMLTIAQWFGTAVSDLGNGILDPIRSVWNSIASAIDGIDIDIGSIEVFGATIFPGIHFHPNIPHLATGGVASNPMLAVIGDTPGQSEIVTPESLMRKIVGEELHQGGGHSTLIVNGNVYDAKDMHAILAQHDRARLRRIRTRK